ncbi:MAG TPA: PEP-CTERM sorting domain-containing protein [Gemmatimonadaceae bacterium]
MRTLDHRRSLLPGALALGASLLLTAARPAMAQGTPTFTQVLTPGALGVAAPTVHTYETFPLGIVSTFDAPGATYTSASGMQRMSAFSAAASSTPSGSYGLWSDGSPITLTFTSPINAFGIFVGNDDTCCSRSVFPFTLDAYGSSGLLASFLVTANMNDAADQFLGFTSDAEVTSVTVGLGEGAGSLGLYVDDATFGRIEAVAVTPEPATLALLAGGLALLGAGAQGRRRRRRSPAA